MSGFLLLFLSLTVLSGTQPSAAATSIDQFRKTIETTTLLEDAERGRLVRDWFMTDLSHLDPRALGDQELRDFFVASLNASSLARDKAISIISRNVFEEMATRKILAGPDYENMQALYIRLRAFDEARRFHESHRMHRGVEAIPGITTAAGLDVARPSHFVFRDDGSLRLENAVLDEQDFVLVVADPLCHFTLDAVAAIEADPKLRAYFSTHSKWLMPDAMSFEVEAVRKWNHALPRYPLSLVNDIRAWKDISYWDTPTFYFFKRGKVARVIRGWPPEGHARELKAILGGDDSRADITQTGP
ncbi:MAG: hypothetical protein M3Y70_06785 [Pseudomonadota bacterium]|nr:hypothetical protein [Pseudomonadota bacterium]